MIQEYVFNLGIECSKIMNMIYSIAQFNSDTRDFFFGDKFVYGDRAITPFSRVLPSTVAGTTGPLFVANAIGKIKSTNTYEFCTGSLNSGSNIVFINDKNLTIFNVVFNNKTATLTPRLSNGIFNNCQSDLKGAFYLNNIVYNDHYDVIYESYKSEELYKYHYFTAGSFYKTYGQTKFSSVCSKFLQSTSLSFNNVSDTLKSGFQDVFENCSKFSNISYSNTTMKENMADLSAATEASVKEFANVDLNV